VSTTEDPVVDHYGNRRCRKCGNKYGRRCQKCCSHGDIGFERDHHEGLYVQCGACLKEFSLEELQLYVDLRWTGEK